MLPHGGTTALRRLVEGSVQAGKDQIGEEEIAAPEASTIIPICVMPLHFELVVFSNDGEQPVILVVIDVAVTVEVFPALHGQSPAILPGPNKY